MISELYADAIKSIAKSNAKMIKDEQYLYHVVDNTYNDAVELLSKYGICSPKDLYKLDKKLFHRRVYDNYHERAEMGLHKTSIKDEDILTWLDTCRLPCTSKCVFFSFATIKEFGFDTSTSVQVQIPLTTIQKYAVGQPIIFLGKTQTLTTIDKLANDLSSLSKKAIKGSRTANNNKLKYKYIIHPAIPLDPIPLKECIIL